MKDYKVRKWYKAQYPTDDLGADIKSTVTFGDLIFTLLTGGDVYATLGVGDSIIRERCFEKLSELLSVDYRYVYELWRDGRKWEDKK